jgi:oligopeptide transport system substrate-binding protein
MLAGCGSSSKSNSNTFRYATETDIMSMDPTIGTDGTSMDAMHAVTDGLEIFDRNGKTVAGIAKSYDVSKDRKTYTFHLRKNVKWVDYQGKTVGTLTAKDFVYAWHRIIKNAGEYAYMLGSSAANIKNADALIKKGTKVTTKELNTLGVKAKDNYTLVVTLEEQVPFFISLMTFGCFYPEYQKYVE